MVQEIEGDDLVMEVVTVAKGTQCSVALPRCIIIRMFSYSLHSIRVSTGAEDPTARKDDEVNLVNLCKIIHFFFLEFIF